MRVAIMGAGLSGLSCAIVLEKHGIVPDIYEARSQVGDRFVNGEIFLSLTSRMAQDGISYISNEFGIYLHPVNMIRSMTIYGPSETAVIEGAIGHSNIRGRNEGSLEHQLSKQIKAKIFFNAKKEYEELQQDYTHIIMATGDGEYARRLRNYDLALTVSMKGGTVEGRFDRYSVYTWLNQQFAPQGYGYLIPFSESEASMVIAYPDYPENAGLDIGALWERFYERAAADMRQELRLTDQFQITKYMIGLCRNSRIGNTFFAGNNFGSIMPFLGFGQFVAILTGVYAAYDLCGLGTYEELTKPLRRSYRHSLVLRRAMEQIGNPQLDDIVKWLDTPVGHSIFLSRRLDILRVASHLARPWLKVKKMI